MKNFLFIIVCIFSTSRRRCWRSVYKFNGEFNSFNILVPKEDGGEDLVRVSFVRTAGTE